MSTPDVSESDEPASKSPGDCRRLMPNPGSRIIEERCYFPSEGEQALNDYQFREELRHLREKMIRDQIEQAEAERIRRAMQGRARGFR